MRIVLTVVAILALATPALAVPLVYEGFNYTIGENIVGQTNVTDGMSRPWIDPVGSPTQPPTPEVDAQDVIAGNIGYEGLPDPTGGSLSVPRFRPDGTTLDNGNMARINILPSGVPSYSYLNAAGGVFYSFTMKMTSWVTVTDATAASQQIYGGFVAGLHWGPLPASQGGMSSAGSYAGQVRIRRELDINGVQTGRYQVGIIKNNDNFNANYGTTGATEAIWSTESYGVNETVFLAGVYKPTRTNSTAPATDFTNRTDDVAALWLNPTPGEAEGAPDLLTPTGTTDAFVDNFHSIVRSFWFRGDSVVPGSLVVDELRVGLSYADVTPGAGLDGDFDGDDDVDGNDFLVWQRGESPNGLVGGDLDDWKANFGLTGASATIKPVPEPSTFIGALALAVTAGASRAFRASRFRRS